MQRNFLLIILLIIFFNSISFAQDREYKVTVTAGIGVSTFLKYVKQPAISVKIFGEKLYDEDKRKYFYIALEYSSLNGASPESRLLSEPGTTTVTFTYKGSKLITLTGGGKRILYNNIFYGVGMGFAIYTQGVPSRYYSDPFLNYTQYKKGNGGWGIGSTAQLGYLLGNFQLSINYHGGYLPFRTIDLSNRDDVDLSSFVLVTGVSVGYSF